MMQHIAFIRWNQSQRMAEAESHHGRRRQLSPIPRPVLSTQELLAKPNAYDAATLKLFALCEFDLAIMGREVQESRWEYFTSRVKLVGPGYRPSKNEMEAIALRRSVLRDMLGF
jgi:hypothetical protein